MCYSYWPVVLVLMFGLVASAAGTKHPSLLLNSAGIEQVKAKVASAAWARAQVDAMKKRVNGAFDSPVELPPRGSNWYHWYVCPEHGNRLKTGKKVGQWEWEHICPTDKKTFRGDAARVETDFDGCALAGVHGDFAGQVRDLGVLYAVTGDARYAARAKLILLAYAGKYGDYPLHTIRNEPKIGGGRVGPQTLDESVWLIPMAQGADLIWQTLSDADRTTLSDRLFLPAARDVILPHKMGVHNIQCWKNSAVGVAGFLLGDQELIKAAIDDPKSGYKVQMKQGVQADGPWWENAWGYHFYTASAVWPLLEAAKNNGADLYGPEYKRMYDGPINFAMPNLVLPNFSDSGFVNLSSQAPLYELAYARYKDADYLSVLAGSKRSDLMSLLFGSAQLPQAPPASPRSANYTGAGFAVLRSAAADKNPVNDTWLCMKWGPYGGGHGHPDKLSFILYTRGKILAEDAGITAYGSPMHGGYYKTSIAHNTLIIDQASQKAVDGKTLAFGQAGGFDYAISDAGAIYDGVSFIRTVALRGADHALVIDQVICKGERTMDIALHQRDRIVQAPEGTAWEPPNTLGYKYLKNATVRPVPEKPVSLAWGDNDAGKASVALAADGPADLILADGPGASSADRVPAIIVRRKGSSLSLAMSIALSDRHNAATLLKSDKPSAVAVRVDAPGGACIVLSNPQRQRVTVQTPKGPWTSDKVFDVKQEP